MPRLGWCLVLATASFPLKGIFSELPSHSCSTTLRRLPLAEGNVSDAAMSDGGNIWVHCKVTCTRQS